VKRLSLSPNKPQLSQEQAAVLKVVLKGQSIFFTGSAGRDQMGLEVTVAGWDGEAAALTFPPAQGQGSHIC
jgi:ATP-dependent DNA helicase PIF1